MFNAIDTFVSFGALIGLLLGGLPFFRITDDVNLAKR